MPKLACPCGYVHNLTPVPDEGWVAVLDRDFEALLAVSAQQRQTGSRAANEPAKAGVHSEGWDQSGAIISAAISRFYECPHCGRLMWQKPGDTHMTVYARETGD